MSQPRYFNETVLLIRGLNSLPPSGCVPHCGYIPSELFEQLNAVFPGHGLTQADVQTVLEEGARRGVFVVTGILNGQCCYVINPGMVGRNPQNIIYAQQQANFTTDFISLDPVARGADAVQGGSCAGVTQGGGGSLGVNVPTPAFDSTAFTCT